MPTFPEAVGVGTVAIRSGSPARPSRRRPAIAVPDRYRNRPYAVRRAIYRVWEQSIAMGLSRSAVAVLQALIAAGVSKDNPFQPVFASKARLADMAGCSEVTVYRALRKLEDSKLIKRIEQTRLDDGSLDIGLITITDRLATILDFNTQQSANKYVQNVVGYSNLQQASVTRNKCQHCCNIGAERQHEPKGCVSNRLRPSLKDGMKDGLYKEEQKVYPKASVENQSTRSAFARIDGRAVAWELVWLVTEKGLAPSALFKLQNLAKKVPGQRLTDFVALRHERLKELRSPGDCYRYLNKLISEGIDARFLSEQRRIRVQHAQEEERTKKSAAQRIAWSHSRHGVEYIDPVSRNTYRINANCGVVEPGKKNNAADSRYLRITDSFIQDVGEGRLIPVERVRDKIDRDLGNRYLDELAAKFPMFRRRQKQDVSQQIQGG